MRYIPIKAVLFDLDNTLYNETDYFHGVFKLFSKAHHLNYLSIRKLFSAELRSSSNDVFGDILKELGIYSPEYHKELFHYYKTIQIDIHLYPDAEKLLEFLIDNNLKTAIVTNGIVEVQKNKIRCLGIEGYFNAVIYARLWGREFEKPKGKPFLKALELLNIDKSEALYVGDNINTDIIGAKNAKMKAVLLDRKNDSSVSSEFYDYRITDLRELVNILRQIGM